MPLATTPRPRVLLVDTLSGANDYGIDLVDALSRHVALTVITVTDTRCPSVAGVRILPVIPGYSIPGQRLWKARAYCAYLLTLVRELWAHRRDCEHVPFFRVGPVEFLVYLCARPWLRRVVHTAHNALPHERRWWHPLLFRRWYRTVDVIHVLGTHTERELVRLGVGHHAIRVVPHGNYERFRRTFPPSPRAEVRGRLNVPLDATVFLQFGQLRAYKGCRRLVDAFCELKPRTKAFLVLAGAGDASLFEDADARLKQAGVSPRALCLRGFVPDQLLSDLIEASDVVVFPYVSISQSGALLLAMTYGKACLASDLEGFRDYTEHGAEALLVDTANRSALVAAMRSLTDDAELRARLSARARSRAVSEFGWERLASVLASLYGFGGEEAGEARRP